MIYKQRYFHPGSVALGALFAINALFVHAAALLSDADVGTWSRLWALLGFVGFSVFAWRSGRKGFEVDGVGVRMHNLDSTRIIPWTDIEGIHASSLDGDPRARAARIVTSGWWSIHLWLDLGDSVVCIPGMSRRTLDGVNDRRATKARALLNEGWHAHLERAN